MRLRFRSTCTLCGAFAVFACVFLSTSCSRKSSDAGATLISGMAETAEIDIAAKVPGRIAEIRVREGAAVHEGDTLALLESRELDAKVGQARAALGAAREKLKLAQNGLRPQEKSAAEKLYMQAKAQADLMEKTWNRVKKLSEDSVISAQERDQTEAQNLSAQEAMEAARQKLSLANEGSRAEDLSAAAAMASQAMQAFEEAVAWRDEQVLVSPISGEVAKKTANRGEMIGAGAPLMTIVDLQDSWVVLNVKENEMSQLRMGAQFDGTVKALGDSTIKFYVSYIAPQGDFATWRPTNQKGGFDLKTFEIHLRPIAPACALRAGMSVQIRMR